eukprot:scaffold23779_cov348-Cylindrotheca_fusiformis.AAC.1
MTAPPKLRIWSNNVISIGTDMGKPAFRSLCHHDLLPYEGSMIIASKSKHFATGIWHGQNDYGLYSTPLIYSLQTWWSPPRSTW